MQIDDIVECIYMYAMEVIAECPKENVKECSKLLAETMSKAAEKILEMPIKCDVSLSNCWYGNEIFLDK